MIPPDLDELEVSLLGPGSKGESAVVHLGNNMWMIVDSCIDSRFGRPAALAYLEQIGVDVATQVALVVVTHWHDDHIRGVAQVVEQCQTARVYIPTALKCDDLLVLAQVARDPVDLAQSAMREFGDLIEILRNRTDQVAFALEGSPLAHPTSVFPAQVVALSPSHRATQAALVEIGTLVPTKGEKKRRVPRLHRNLTSIAMWVGLGEARALLGADVEATADPRMGWTAIVDSPVRPRELCQLLKVAHHGSANGHNAGVWGKLLVDDPVGLLAPFHSGSVTLPTRAGEADLCRRTRELYATSRPQTPPRTTRRPGALGREIKATTRWIREAQLPTGHVRARKKTGSADWRIELFGAATELCV